MYAVSVKSGCGNGNGFGEPWISLSEPVSCDHRPTTVWKVGNKISHKPLFSHLNEPNVYLPFGFGKNVSGAWLDHRDANTGRTLGNSCGLWTTFSSGGVVACIKFHIVVSMIHQNMKWNYLKKKIRIISIRTWTCSVMFGRYDDVAAMPLPFACDVDASPLCPTRDSSSSLEWLEASSKLRPSVSDPESESLRDRRPWRSSRWRRLLLFPALYPRMYDWPSLL